MKKNFTKIIHKIMKIIKNNKKSSHIIQKQPTQNKTAEIPKIDQKKIKIIAFLIIGTMVFGTIFGIFKKPSKKNKENKNQSVINNTIIPSDFEILSKDRKRVYDEHAERKEELKYGGSFSSSDITIPQEFSNPSRTASRVVSQEVPYSYNNNSSWIRAYQKSQNTGKNKSSSPSMYVKGWNNNGKTSGAQNSLNSAKNMVNTLLKNSSSREASVAEALSLQNKTSYDKQNQQDEKKEFLENARNQTTNTSISPQIEKPQSPFIISAGSIIPITIITSINSNLPGDIVGQVNRSVYDSVTGNFLLIPAGSKVVGNYDSNVAWGQRRVLVVWNRLLLPNGDSINLEGMQGIDLLGHAGYNDKIDLHIGEIIGVTLASTILNIGQGQLSTFSSQQSNQYLQSLTNALTSSASNTTGIINKIANKIINMQPTLKIRSGKRANIFVGKDLILHPYKRRF